VAWHRGRDLVATGLRRRVPGMAEYDGHSIMDISRQARTFQGPVRPGDGMSGPAATQSVLGRLQQSVINPVVRLAWDLGIPIPGDALLETTGRRTRLPRRTPVCDGLEGETFWLIAQGGRDADWVRNIEASPRVRVKVSGIHAGWRSGTAHILDDDDPQERQRILSQANLARRLCMSTSKALHTNPLTIRVDLDSE
jgi:deazaflavin-dependent oxidoreductase (nitroreductase family)